MFPRQYAPRRRVLSLALAALGLTPLATSAVAQTTAIPAAPTPQPTAPGSLPSVPPQTPGSLDTPLPQTPAAPATAQPYNNPLEAPIPLNNPQPTTPATPAAPLEQPITIQPAQPPQAAPVTMPEPAAVASLPSVATDLPTPEPPHHKDHLGSVYIPDDSWVYPAALRLYSLGYLNTTFLSMRPWTRRSLLHMLERSAPDIRDAANPEAQDIYAKLLRYVSEEVPGPDGSLSSEMTRGAVYGLDTAYTRLMGISGLTLRDSYHLGQTLVNDYGRPYQPGFNNITGFSTTNEWNRFSFYLRGEYQHAPSAAGYNLGLATYLSSVDEILPFAPPNQPQATIPYGPIASANPFRLQEAYVSFHLLGHEVSGGKSDAWLGPAQGGAMAWSNNAENIYSFRINRVEPMYIPYFSRVFGPLRYDFFVGSLKGHTFPNDPWVHSEMFSLRPTSNFEFSFQRTVLWGGHCTTCVINPASPGIDEPVTLHTFFRSFFSLSDTQGNSVVKGTPQDPGARFSNFSFSWRLPFLRWVTLYTDAESHDDVSPISAPRRAAYRPGVYLARLPGAPKFDLRLEASSTDCSTLICRFGSGQYFEAVQRNGYTNQGFLFGDWIGREAIAYQGWLTYHLSGNEWVQASFLHKMTPKDFIANGVNQSQFKLDVVKRLRPDIELNAWYQYEHWTAPVYQTTHQTDNIVAFQFTFYPKLRSTAPHLNGK